MSRFGTAIKSLIALTSFCAVACSLVFDASDIDRGCPGQQKFCESAGRCVDRGPAYGCGASCTPCVIPNAIPTCAAEACAIEECVWGFTASDKSNPPNDCSINFLVDREHCGAPPNTQACPDGQNCVNGACASQADDSLQ